MRAVLRQSACLRARARQGETKRKVAQRMKKGSLRLMYLGALCAALLLVGALPALADGTGDIGVDEIHFPDELFREYVAENADTDGDGLLSAEEIADVHGIHVRFHGIQDLTGIEHFTALAYLDCSANSLTSLDVTANGALRSLYCSDNQLTALDVTENGALERLDCGSNRLMALEVPDDAVYDRLIGGAQSPTAEVAGSADGTWSVDLAALVPGWAERVNNVTVTGAEMDGSVVTWSDGSVQPTVVYHYDTDSGDAWVELTLIPVEASDASDASDADLWHKKP